MLFTKPCNFAHLLLYLLEVIYLNLVILISQHEKLYNLKQQMYAPQIFQRIFCIFSNKGS